MTQVLLTLDFLTVLAAFGSAILWFLSSRNRVRRISRHEELDAADINRIVVALNRSQILSARAAAMTGLAALLASIRLSLNAVSTF